MPKSVAKTEEKKACSLHARQEMHKEHHKEGEEHAEKHHKKKGTTLTQITICKRFEHERPLENSYME